MDLERTNDQDISEKLINRKKIRLRSSHIDPDEEIIIDDHLSDDEQEKDQNDNAEEAFIQDYIFEELKGAPDKRLSHSSELKKSILEELIKEERKRTFFSLYASLVYNSMKI